MPLSPRSPFILARGHTDGTAVSLSQLPAAVMGIQRTDARLQTIRVKVLDCQAIFDRHLSR